MIDAIGAWLNGLTPWALAFVVVVLLDLVGGVALAHARKVFTWERLPNFLLVAVLYFYAWITCEVLGLLPDLLGVEVEGMSALLSEYGPKGLLSFILVTKYGTSIVGHIQAIKNESPWGGIPFE
jgi:hypothetical protein